jgi:hypothetical protein
VTPAKPVLNAAGAFEGYVSNARTGGKSPMKRKMLAVLSAAACSLLLTIPMAAQQKSTSNAQTTAKGTMKTAWAPEEFTGKIMQVDAGRRLLIVKDASGVPFDMIVTRSTRIKSGDQTLKLNNLASDTSHQVSIRFVPEGRGDVARSIQLAG